MSAAARRALVVDDEEIVASFLCEILREADYDVEHAASAGEAVSRFERQPWSVAIVDKNLPDMNGIELTRALLRADPESRVLIVTAYGSPESAVDAFRAGVSDFVLKPIDDVQSFLARVESAIERPRPPADAFAGVDPGDFEGGLVQALEELRRRAGCG